MTRARRRLLPVSLLGQVMLALALGLLAAQAISGVLLYRAEENRREGALVNSLVLRLFAREVAPPEQRPGLRGRMAVTSSATSPVGPGDERATRLEKALDDTLRSEGIAAHAIHVTTRLAGRDAGLSERMIRRLERRDPDWRSRGLLIAAIQREAGGRWDVVRAPLPRRERAVLGPIVFQTLVIFLVLFTIMYLVLRRLTRPLHRLTERLAAFSARPDEPAVLEEDGPEDMRRLIAAHNRMERRIATLIDEKDVMLGAIGHDLKTPLAALRVRIESVPDETQRARMAQVIEDIAATLDDILNLARVGRGTDAPERVDLAALAAGVVEEFEDLAQPVTLAGLERTVRPVHVTWLKRALRNLVSNAVRYGGSASVSLTEQGGEAVLAVEDDGPGIAADRLDAMTEPFTRGEASRNRATGGAGLGLTLAKSIARQHGGRLVLANRPGGGLRAELRLPPL